jgi:hypothetical protein
MELDLGRYRGRRTPPEAAEVGVLPDVTIGTVPAPRGSLMLRPASFGTHI